MGLRDRATKLAKAAAAKAEAGLDARGVDVRGVVKSTADLASSAAAKAKAEAEAHGFDPSRLVDAAKDGLDVTDRRGNVRKRKVARKLLNPAGLGRKVGMSLGRELLLQHRSNTSASGESVDPSVFDDAFFVELVDWTLESAGAPDTEESRMEAVLFLASSGIDRYASAVLNGWALEAYIQAGDELVDLTARAEALLLGRPQLAPGLLEQLDMARSEFAWPTHPQQ